MAKLKRSPKPRKAETPNKASRDIKGLAQEHGAALIKRLAEIAMNPSSPEAAQIAACKELLDRGYGRPPQAIEGTEDGPPIKQVIQIVTGVPRD